MTSDPRIPLRNTWLAGILAFALPGAGHYYQGRYFKAGVYFFTIMGLFVSGLLLSGGQAIQPPLSQKLIQSDRLLLLKFGTQACVGTPVLYSLWQRSRYLKPDNVATSTLSGPLTADFKGHARFNDQTGFYEGPISGKVFLEPVQGQFGGSAITGRFEGRADGREVKLQFSDNVRLGKPVDASKEREFSAQTVTMRGDQQVTDGVLRGSIPRGFWNWFQVPVSKENNQKLHGELGKYLELALLFTWVAGLLNILAIWDAVEGPAYGFGRKLHEESSTSGKGILAAGSLATVTPSQTLATDPPATPSKDQK